MVPISYLKKLFSAYCGLAILENSINKLDCNDTHKRDTQSKKLRTKVAVCTFTHAYINIYIHIHTHMHIYK